MDITLRDTDSFRVMTDQGNNFIDVHGMNWQQGIQVAAYPHFHYIEVREKEGMLSIFFFKNKRAKKDLDLKWWQNAEVVYAKNEVHHKD